MVLRGANEFMLEEMDRALHDSLCVIKRMLDSNSLVAGGGAVEVALSVYLEVRTSFLILITILRWMPILGTGHHHVQQGAAGCCPGDLTYPCLVYGLVAS